MCVDQSTQRRTVRDVRISSDSFPGRRDVKSSELSRWEIAVENQDLQPLRRRGEIFSKRRRIGTTCQNPVAVLMGQSNPIRESPMEVTHLRKILKRLSKRNCVSLGVLSRALTKGLNAVF